MQDVLAICPNAWYIMVANPVQGGVTYLQRKYKNAKIIGMCHGYTGVYTLTDAMGMDRKDVSYEIAGVNHFIWLTSFRYQGKNAYPLLDQWLKMHHGKIVENVEEIEKIGLKADEISPKAIDLYKGTAFFQSEILHHLVVAHGDGSITLIRKRKLSMVASRISGMKSTLRKVNKMFRKSDV